MTAAPTAGDALALVRLAASGAAGALARHASRIDDINVFPVPDGDTGANLSQTARSVLDALQANSLPEPSAIARVGARAALLGARGNSGIILSQLVRGACDRLGEGGPLDGPAIADALRRASTEADAALREPVEGTILTVARALADGAEAARSDDPIATLAAGLAAAEVALARTPDMLPVAARGGRRRRGRRRASSSSCAARSPRCAASRSPRPRRSGSTSTTRSRPTTPARATAPGFLVAGAFPREQLERAARAARRLPRRRLATASSCARTCTPTTRASRSRPPPRSARSRASRSATCTRSATRSPSAPRRRSRRSRTTAAWPTCSRSSTATATACSTRASARACCWRPPDRRRARSTPSARARPPASCCCPNDPGLQVVAEYAAQAAPRAGARRALARARAGPRGARRLPHRPAGRRARRGVRGGRGLGRAAPRSPGGDGDDAAALREAVAPRARAGLDARHGARRARRPSEAALDALADWLAEAHPGVELELHAGGQAHPRYSVSAE